jgi:hypothetical protein
MVQMVELWGLDTAGPNRNFGWSLLPDLRPSLSVMAVSFSLYFT